MRRAPRRPEATPAEPTTGRQKLLLVVLGLALSALLLVAIEGLLALFGAGELQLYEDPFVGFAPGRRVFVERTLPGGERVYATSVEKLSFFNPQQFPHDKAEGTYRVFALGGSTTAGRPYDARVAFPAWLEAYLDAAEPERRHEVINAGAISYASYRIVVLMKELVRYEPDLFVVYTGHNEFLEERTYADIIHQGRVKKQLRLWLNRHRLPTLLRHFWLSLRPARQPPPTTLEAEVVTRLEGWTGLELYTRDPELERSVVEHFEYNLDQMAALARSAGADLLFVQPASNLKDFSPFKSEHAAALAPAERSRFARLLAEGRTALEAGSPRPAATALEAALAIDGEYAEAHFLLGRSLLETGAAAAALGAFVLAKDLDVAPLRAIESLVERVGSVAAAHGLPAIDLPRILAEDSRQRFGHEVLGNEYFLDHVHPDIPVHSLIAERVMEELGRRGLVRIGDGWSTERRDEIYQRRLAALDREYYAQRDLNLAKVLGWAGKLAEAEAPLLRAAPLLPDEPEVPLNLGILYQKTGRPAKAVEALLRAVALDPESPEARFNLGVAYGELGRAEEAARALEEAIRLRPRYPEAYFNLGSLRRQQGDLEAALTAFGKARELKGETPEVELQLARTYRRAGDLEGAAAALERLLGRTPDHVAALTELGIVEARRGRGEEAQRRLERALALEPGYAEAHYNLGVLLAAEGRPEEALAAYARALEAAPGHAEALNNRGVLHARAARLAEAERDFLAAVEGRPGWAEPRFNLGLVYQQGGRAGDALAAMQRAAELAPEDGRIQLGLAVVQLQLGRERQAAEHLARAERLGAAIPPELRARLEPREP